MEFLGVVLLIGIVMGVASIYLVHRNFWTSMSESDSCAATTSLVVFMGLVTLLSGVNILRLDRGSCGIAGFFAVVPFVFCLGGTVGGGCAAGELWVSYIAKSKEIEPLTKNGLGDEECAGAADQ